MRAFNFLPSIRQPLEKQTDNSGADTDAFSSPKPDRTFRSETRQEFRQ
jgi:hypothetical protein